MKRTNILSSFFDFIREVIESAETPFVLLALVILPIISPLVPAFVTGTRLIEELQWKPWVAWTTAAVLELLGYVGAIAFIKSIYRLRREGIFLPVFLNGFAYFFYVFVMYLVNVRLGFLSGDSTIVNEIFAMLSFLTIPTGLLAAEHVSERSRKEEEERKRKDEKEEAEQIRRERSAERLEKARIQAGKSLESSEKVSSEDGKKEESFQKVSDWRKVRPQLSRKDLEDLANLSPAQMARYAAEAHVTYKTISNWRNHARKELGLG
jgi:hypothetical protein